VVLGRGWRGGHYWLQWKPEGADGSVLGLDVPELVVPPEVEKLLSSIGDLAFEMQAYFLIQLLLIRAVIVNVIAYLNLNISFSK